MSNNIRAKKKLIKMSEKLEKMLHQELHMNREQLLEMAYYEEEVWEQCFKAFPEKKTNEDIWYMNNMRMWNIISDAYEYVEETA
jgi:hypothetical protein